MICCILIWVNLQIPTVNNRYRLVSTWNLLETRNLKIGNQQLEAHCPHYKIDTVTLTCDKTFYKRQIVYIGDRTQRYWSKLREIELHMALALTANKIVSGRQVCLYDPRFDNGFTEIMSNFAKLTLVAIDVFCDSVLDLCCQISFISYRNCEHLL